MPDQASGKERIGFVGAGMMGSGMCVNLMKAGYPLTVIANRNRERIEALVADGAREATTLADLAAASDVVMICVNSAESVREIVAGLSDGLRPGMMIIDITTSLPEVTRELAAELATRDVTLIDAPVVAGPAQAMQGKLGTFIGGSDEAVARAMPIVSTYSEDVAHFGPTGSAHTAKLLNNFLTVGLRQLVTHSFRAARRNNIDMAKLYAMVAKGAAGSRTVDQFVQGAIVGDYSGNKFSIGNCYKDMSYAEALFSDDPDGAAIQKAMVSAYARLVEAGHGDRLASEMLNPEVEASTR
jgi:3-hydroxyisobutyrate dehydrogenase-like beta-hydroxyacid dehydrogenase